MCFSLGLATACFSKLLVFARFSKLEVFGCFSKLDVEDLTGGQGGRMPDFGGGIDEVAIEVEPECGSDYDYLTMMIRVVNAMVKGQGQGS